MLSSTRVLRLLFLVLVATRIGYAVFLPNTIPHWRDGLSYDNIARHLIAGEGYRDTLDLVRQWPNEPVYADPRVPTTFRLPGYPFFLAIVYSIAGISHTAVYVTQALISIAIGALVYWYGGRLFGPRVAVVALLLYTVDPFSLYLIGRYQTENLFTLLTIATLCCFSLAGTSHRRRTSLIMAALAAAGAAHVRAVGGLMFAGLCLAVFLGLDQDFGRLRLAARVRSLALASVVFLAAISPWVLRNYQLTGHYVWTSEDWLTIAMGNNDAGSIYFSQAGLDALPRTTVEQSEMERQRIYRSFVTDWVRRHPGKFVQLTFQRIVAFWSPAANFVTGPLAAVAMAFNLFLWIFVAAGLWAAWNGSSRLTLIVAIFASFTVGYGIAIVTSRFRLPLYPLLEILAAAGMVSSFETIKTRVLIRRWGTEVAPVPALARSAAPWPASSSDRRS